MNTNELRMVVIDILRQRGVFEIAARASADWLKHLEEKYPKGPRGGRHPLIRYAEKTAARIQASGQEAAFETMVSLFTYHAERWLQMTDPDVTEHRPYLQYHCACLPDSRPSHTEKHRLILPIAHPFWSTWYPINGLGCLCTVTTVSEFELTREKSKVSDVSHFNYLLPDEGFVFNIGKLLVRR